MASTAGAARTVSCNWAGSPEKLQLPPSNNGDFAQIDFNTIRKGKTIQSFWRLALLEASTVRISFFEISVFLIFV